MLVVCWWCVGGVLMASGEDEDPSKTGSPVCICNQGLIPMVGVKVSFWEPSRIIETVSDAFCMVSMGASLKKSEDGKLNGGLINDSSGGGKAFQQMHYYIFPKNQFFCFHQMN